MNSIKYNFDYDSAQFIINDDAEKTTILISKEVINNINIIKEPNKNDSIDFYNEYKYIAMKNRTKTNNNFKSYILFSDFDK